METKLGTYLHIIILNQMSKVRIDEASAKNGIQGQKVIKKGIKQISPKQ